MLENLDLENKNLRPSPSRYVWFGRNVCKQTEFSIKHKLKFYWINSVEA